MRSLHDRIKAYVYDTSVSLQDRSFILFSLLMLMALYLAVPFGIVMREPVSATVSTLLGAIAFTAFVYYVFQKNKIAQAKLVLSIIVVVVFLPVMFFTNGGANGGAPIWLLLGTIYIGLILEGRTRIVMLVIDSVLMIVCRNWPERPNCAAISAGTRYPTEYFSAPDRTLKKSC